jgi:CBS domain containing-hemolysin-like protein
MVYKGEKRNLLGVITSEDVLKASFHTKKILGHKLLRARLVAHILTK